MSLFGHLDPADYALPTDLTRDLLSPALVVYLDNVRHNVRVVIERAGDVDRWRPHVKTSKLPAVWAELAAAGVRHFKCATTREALHLGRMLDAQDVAGADVLLAHPLVGPALERLGQIARAHPATRFDVLCEAAEIVRDVPPEVGVYVDVNPGMDRTGIPLGQDERIHAVARAAGARFRGVHFYDGHLHDLDGAARAAQVHAGYAPLLELVAGLAAAGSPVAEVITAGTPAFLAALDHAPLRALEGTLHRVSPGTVTFHDARSQAENPQLPLRPAALVFTRVVSHPAADRVTCDAGSKSLAAEAGDPCAEVLGHPELVAETPNEEHLPLRVRAGERPRRGTELLLVPRHVCPTVNLAEEAVLIEGGAVREVAPVAARAHELLLRR
jgi:D-serine deaminase-like pyridoxal phosphate-dependent protein